VYVGPKDRQSIVGRFASTNPTLDCSDLNRIRSVTWRFPLPAEVQSAIAAGQAYSPAFDALFAVAARNINVLEKIVAKKLEAADFLESHAALFAEYTRALEVLRNLEADLTTLQTARQSAQLQLNADLSTAAMELDPTAKAEAVAQARAAFAAENARLNAAESELTPRLLTARQEYAVAKGRWAPYGERLTELDKVELSLSTSYAAIQAIADASLGRSRKLIGELEAPVVGYATAGYAVYSDEVKQVTDAVVAKHAPLSVTRMPIFDVRTNSSVTITSFATSGKGFSREYNTYTFPLDTLLPIGTTSTHELPFKNESGPTALRFLATDVGPSDSSSGSFDFPVTQAAMCGYATSATEIITADIDGKKIDRRVDRLNYAAPPPNQAVFTQSVGLQYKTNIEAEPLAATCSLNVDTTDTYYRTSGRSTTWSGFTKKTKTWDDTKRSYENDLGLKCTLTLRPAGTTADSAQISEAFERAAYDDMFQLFLATYAKSYTVEAVPPAELAPAATKVPGIGAGVMQLCGLDKRCAFGAIVLKTLEEMGGSRYNASTSDQSHKYGRISRDFRLNTFLTRESAAVIDMRVCVDASQCQ
jgi:hypothetical protein